MADLSSRLRSHINSPPVEGPGDRSDRAASALRVREHRRQVRERQEKQDFDDIIVAGWPTEDEMRVGADRRAEDRRAGADRRSGFDRRYVQVAPGTPGMNWDGVERRADVDRRTRARREAADRRAEADRRAATMGHSAEEQDKS